MKSIKSGMYIYVFLDIILLVVSAFLDWKWLVNSQIAFFSAFSIVLLSFLSYLKNINKQIKTLGDIIENKDIIDEMDDPYELYDKEEKNEKIDKIKLSMKNLRKTKGATFAFFRILGYMILIAGFFLLVKTGSFSIIPYISGISIIPLGGLVNIIYQRKFN